MLATDRVKLISAEDDLRVYRLLTDAAWEQNCYLVHDLPTSKLILVDPGGDVELIERTLSRCRGKLDRILITHPHHDHIGAAAEMVERHGIPCELHREDQRLLRHAPMYAEKFAGRRLTIPVSCVFFDALELESVYSRRLVAIHTPGHTKGSVCYWLGSLLFTGDTLLHESGGRTDLPGGCRTSLVDSIERLLRDLPCTTTLLPGHGDVWTIGAARSWWPTGKQRYL